jgi:hypothetical protein
MSRQQVTMKTVSPAMARSLISISEATRPWDMRLVQQFQDQMMANQWVEGASVYDPIRVVSGRLVNGKLRLAALDRAGVTMRMAFVYDGEAPESPGWVKTYREEDGDLVLTVTDPSTKTGHQVRVTEFELSEMLTYLRDSQKLTGTQAAAEHLAGLSSRDEYRGRHRRALKVRH